MLRSVNQVRASQSDQGHAAFLKRNGAMLAQILQETTEPAPEATLNLLEELTVLIATGRSYGYLDGRERRAFAGLFRTTTPTDRVGWRCETWRSQFRFTRSVAPAAAEVLTRFHAALSTRADFPKLNAMKAWGHPRWEALMLRIGAEPTLASTITSIILDREELPGGPDTRRMYQRLGYVVEKDGRPSPLAMFPEDLRRCKSRLQRVAHEICARALRPGLSACDPCPIKAFCNKYRSTTQPKRDARPSFVDVFAGGGGMSLGLSNAGLHLRLAVEKERHAADTLYLNHPEAPNGVVDARDIRKLLSDRSKLAKLKGIDVLAGGPPCQPFSMARRHSNADTTDPRRFLFRAYLQLVKKVRPRIVILENVPGIRNAAGGDISDAIHKEFEAAGYTLRHRLLNASDYGVPQNRQRFFFIGVRRAAFRHPARVISDIFAHIDGAKISRVIPAWEALSGLPVVRAGEGSQAMRGSKRGRKTVYAREMADGENQLVYNHETRAHNPRDLEIFRALIPGETAESLEARKPGIIPYQLESFGDKYRKIHPDRAAPTIPAHLHRDANSFVHFAEPRGITPREAARFQSFPDKYVFLGGFGPSFIQIGNAVPPKLAQVVGEAVKAVLGGARLRARRASRNPQRDIRYHAPRIQARTTRHLSSWSARGRLVPGSPLP